MRVPLTLLLFLAGCADSSQVDYWSGDGPTITSHSPASVGSLLGGETMKIVKIKKTRSETPYKKPCLTAPHHFSDAHS